MGVRQGWWVRPCLLAPDWFVAQPGTDVGATGSPGVRWGARGRSPAAALRAGGPPAAEAEATGGLPPGSSAAAICRQHLLPGLVGRSSPRLHEEAEPGVWRGRLQRGPSSRQKGPLKRSRLRGPRLLQEAASPIPRQRRFGLSFPPTDQHVLLRLRCVACTLWRCQPLSCH